MWHAAKFRLTRVFFPIGFVALVRAAIDARMATAAMAAHPAARGPGFWPESQNVASCDLLDFIEATGRDCSLSTTSVNRRGSPTLPRAELGINGLKARAATGLEKSEKRGVQAARNGPSEDRKCWQRVELGTHGLNR